MNKKKENQNNYIKITIGNKSQDFNNIDNLLNQIGIKSQKQKLRDLKEKYPSSIDYLKSELDKLNNILGIKSSEQKLKELAAEYNKKQQEKLKNLMKNTYLNNISSFNSNDLKSIYNSMNNYYAAIHPSYRKSLKNFLETNFSYLLKDYFSQDYLEPFKASIDKTIFETFENTIVEKTYIKTDEKLSLKEKIEFLFNTANNIYNSLENRLKTEQAKDLLNIIYSNLDFMNSINLDDSRITRPKRFFNFLKDNFLNFIDDEKKTYSLLEKIIINFLLYYDKFYEIYNFANEIRLLKGKDIFYLHKNKNYKADEILYIIGNIPHYNKAKYKLITNIIKIISNQFNIDFQSLKLLFSFLIVEQDKKSTANNAKNQLINSIPDKNFINFLTNFNF